MSERWIRGPIGQDAELRVTRAGCRTVLVVIPTMAAGTRLRDLQPLLQGDHRVLHDRSTTRPRSAVTVITPSGGLPGLRGHDRQTRPPRSLWPARPRSNRSAGVAGQFLEVCCGCCG